MISLSGVKRSGATPAGSTKRGYHTRAGPAVGTCVDMFGGAAPTCELRTCSSIFSHARRAMLFLLVMRSPVTLHTWLTSRLLQIKFCGDMASMAAIPPGDITKHGISPSIDLVEYAFSQNVMRASQFEPVIPVLIFQPC